MFFILTFTKHDLNKYWSNIALQSLHVGLKWMSKFLIFLCEFQTLIFIIDLEGTLKTMRQVEVGLLIGVNFNDLDFADDLVYWQ